MRATDSLAFRVIGLSSLWIVLALFVVAGLIATIYERTVSRGFDDLLVAQLYNLVSSVDTTEGGMLVGNPDLGDLRYSRPRSGWYWEVLPVGDETEGRLASVSLGAEQIPMPPTSEIPFDLQFRRFYEAKGLAGETLRVAETEVLLNADNHVARFRVMGNQSAMAADVNGFTRTLALYLGIVGVGSILVNALAILLGLKPLDRARKALNAVSEGRAQRLDGWFPTEIRPLTDEVNGLIENNRRIVDRARTQVGNLAHSLKTPIAVLMNEATAIGGERGRVVEEQSARMRTQVQHYLDRARVAAQNQTAVYRAPAAPLLERLLRVMEKLNPRLDIGFVDEANGAIVFAGERQDYEEIVGNLLENAAKWTRSTIRVTLSAVEDGGSGRFATVVEDDGSGLSEAEIAEATKRGQRLDEAVPGTGLGLSIVKDTVLEYKGSLVLSRSDLGGLKAVVVLPRAGGEA